MKGQYSRGKIWISFWNKLPNTANNPSIDGIPMQINNSDLNQKCNIIMKGVFKLDNLKKFRPESALNVIFYWKVYNSQSSVVRRVAMPSHSNWTICRLLSLIWSEQYQLLISTQVSHFSSPIHWASMEEKNFSSL